MHTIFINYLIECAIKLLVMDGPMGGCDKMLDLQGGTAGRTRGEDKSGKSQKKVTHRNFLSQDKKYYNDNLS